MFTLKTRKQFKTYNTMQKVNENDFVSYTIKGAGWSVTLNTLRSALREWGNVGKGELRGNKPNGDYAILDTK